MALYANPSGHATSRRLSASQDDFTQVPSWLVVWTPLKNISQLGWVFPIYGKIKNVPNHQPDSVIDTDPSLYPSLDWFRENWHRNPPWSQRENRCFPGKILQSQSIEFMDAHPPSMNIIMGMNIRIWETDDIVVCLKMRDTRIPSHACYQFFTWYRTIGLPSLDCCESKASVKNSCLHKCRNLNRILIHGLIFSRTKHRGTISTKNGRRLPEGHAILACCSAKHQSGTPFDRRHGMRSLVWLQVLNLGVPYFL